MINEEQRDFILELLDELESQVMPGEYYSLDPRFFVEDAKQAEKLFGVKYEFPKEHWRVIDGNIVHKNDSSFRRR